MAQIYDALPQFAHNVRAIWSSRLLFQRRRPLPVYDSNVKPTWNLRGVDKQKSLTAVRSGWGEAALDNDGFAVDGEGGEDKPVDALDRGGKLYLNVLGGFERAVGAGRIAGVGLAGGNSGGGLRGPGFPVDVEETIIVAGTGQGQGVGLEVGGANTVDDAGEVGSVKVRPSR